MSSLFDRVHGFFASIVTREGFDRTKLLLLSLAFTFVIGGYTVTRTMKDTLFKALVGQEFIPIARFWSIIMLIPGVILFSKLVDVVKREQLIYIYSLFYGIGGLVIAFLLGHPQIGLPNIEAGSGRLFGWIIYLFIEGYNPFLVSVLWSFVNSITSPEESKVNYPVMVAFSKIGGMLTATFGCYLLQLPCWSGSCLGEIMAHQLVLVFSSLLILGAPICVYFLMRLVPKRQLHGYEAAYRADKHEEEVKEREAEYAKRRQSDGFIGWVRDMVHSVARSLYHMFSGFILLLRYPYAFGMFAIVFLWEVVNSFVSFERLAVEHESLTRQTCYLLQQDFLIHAGGFLIVMIGTRMLVELLGERRSLLLVPLSTGLLLAYYYSAPSAWSMKLVYVFLRLINFAFAVPLRERLYTPTIKAIKFKSKSWIDSFGAKLAKGAGSAYNIFAMGLSDPAKVTVGIGFFSSVIGFWVIAAHAVGKAFERAVMKNEVIGLERDKPTV